jgi:WD40 repeat protein
MVRFAPLLRHDGKFTAEFSGMASASSPSPIKARIWDAATGALKHEMRDDKPRCRLRTFPGERASRHGTQSGTIESAASILERSSSAPTLIGRTMRWHSAPMHTASSSEDGTVRLWDPANGQPLDARCSLNQTKYITQSPLVPTATYCSRQR